MASRIEQIIGEIEEYIDGCRFQPLSTTKIVVNKEELEELLRELRLKTPDEIKRYQKIISNKDAILADAQEKAEKIIANAQAQAQEMISQHEVTQQAYQQANDTINRSNMQAQEILDSATTDANNIRYSAISYTDEMLGNLADLLDNALADAMPKYKAMIDSLQSALNIVNRNRSELDPQAVEPVTPRQPSSYQEPEEEDTEEEESYEEDDEEVYEDADDDDDDDYDDYDDGDEEE
ncbi:MAG: ATPase [Lachnospiraceae bacterium]|nr:ATPase [Lachnospiraceae bacterium]